MQNATTQALILALALSADCFAASLAYGADQIRIPFSSALLISLSCCLLSGISLFAGAALQDLIPPVLTHAISFAILFFLSVGKLLESTIKAWIQKSCSPAVEFHLFSVHFLLRVICDSTSADADRSKTLSLKEAAALSAALSLDGIAAGISAGLSDFQAPLFLLSSFFFGLCAVLAGSRAGNRAAARGGSELSWISGIILLILSFCRL